MRCTAPTHIFIHSSKLVESTLSFCAGGGTLASPPAGAILTRLAFALARVLIPLRFVCDDEAARDDDPAAAADASDDEGSARDEDLCWAEEEEAMRPLSEWRGRPDGRRGGASSSSSSMSNDEEEACCFDLPAIMALALRRALLLFIDGWRLVVLLLFVESDKGPRLPLLPPLPLG